MFSCFAKMFGDYNSRMIKKYEKVVDTINDFEEKISLLSNDELKHKTTEFKKLLENGATLDDILPEAFAVVRETSKRVLGMRHFDVQLIGGMALHGGQIAEMKTGEGKTLVATLAVYLNALPGKGVHVVTVNDYLAKRDANWMGQIYQFLGLSVSTIISGMSDSRKKEAYAADISYGTNHEFGFDYLRDNLKFTEEEMVMRSFNFAIIDEADSILIDEARTPLIISGIDNNASQLYILVDVIVKTLSEEDFEKDDKLRIVTLTDVGVEKIEAGLNSIGLLKSPGLYDHANISVVYHVNCALKANKLFTKDIDYMVHKGQVMIIDEFTGRMMEGRRYSEGLHQAIEAKEGVEVQTESQTIATISYQNLFRLYPKLAGMTGTAMTEEAEIDEIYKLKVVSVPSHMPVVRIDHEDSIFLSLEEKDRAVIQLIKECVQRNQPVLVGTTSLERSEYFSKLLMMEGVEHNVLNAKQHEREAYVVAEAGAPGVVTIATNMAGRGTDIKLGGCWEMRTELECKDITDPIAREEKIQEIKKDVERKHTIVKEAGGLFVIGTERNDSRRIDNQLRGRSGRQGDPGASKYFLSLEDDLLKRFGSPNFKKAFQRAGMQKDEALTHRWISKGIEKAQQKVEAFNFDIRKQLLRFDDVMNDQRKIVYEQRRSIIGKGDASQLIRGMLDDALDSVVSKVAPAGTVPMDWNVEELKKICVSTFSVELDFEEIAKDPAMTPELLREKLEVITKEAYDRKLEKYGQTFLQYVEKDIALKTVDKAWREHLISLEHLRRGINLTAYAQKNPLNEYKFESFNLFQEMLHNVKLDVLTAIFNFETNVERQVAEAFTQEFEQPSVEDSYTPIRDTSGDNSLSGVGRSSPLYEAQVDDAIEGAVTDAINEASRTRNAICFCGSGKKYKHCHGAIDAVKFTSQEEEQEYITGKESTARINDVNFATAGSGGGKFYAPQPERDLSDDIAKDYGFDKRDQTEVVMDVETIDVEIVETEVEKTKPVRKKKVVAKEEEQAPAKPNVVRKKKVVAENSDTPSKPKVVRKKKTESEDSEKKTVVKKPRTKKTQES